MVITKTLALKTLSGLVAVGATVGSVFLLGSNLSSSGNDPEVEKLTVGELLGKVGLSCGLEDNATELTGDTPKDCTVKTEGSINVKVGEQEEEGVKYSSNTSKLKLSKEEGYPKSLKFVVDSGDLNLTRGNTPASTIKKLGQFETYEIKREGEKFYLSRKTEAKEEKKKVLGLGKCTLPESGDSDCSLTTTEEIKKVKFENQSEGVTVSSGTVDLKISKVSDNTFPDGYRFTFTFPSDVTIDSKKKKANTPYDFKIKKTQNSNTLTLENAWTLDSLGKKVGLEGCNETSNECTVGSNLKVKQDDKSDTGLSKDSSSSTNAKIKVTKDVEGYNQGFKFTISDASIKLTGGTASKDEDKIKGLDEYETYEIKEEGSEWYLVRKEKIDAFIKKELNIEGVCVEALPAIGEATPTTCTIEAIDKLKSINFENKSHNWTVTGEIEVQLSIERDSSTNELKFTFEKESSKDGNTKWCLPGESSCNGTTTSVEYKIKKTSSAGTVKLTLEKKK